MKNLHIITVATESKYYFPYLVDSIKKHNNELTVLGFNEKWRGFNWRCNLMKKLLLSYNKTDIICFIDGYDVLCVRNLNKLNQEFIKIKNREKCKIIVGYDYIPNKIIKFITSLYFTNNIKECVINAGTYIGYVEDILDILSNISDNDNEDDQVLLNKYNNKYPGNIYIDINAELFLTVGDPLNDIKKYTNIDNNIVYSLNKTKPFFIHAAGGGYLDNIIIELGYNYNININKIIKNDYLIKMYKLYKNIIIRTLSKNKYKILFIIIIIILLFYAKN